MTDLIEALRGSQGLTEASVHGMRSQVVPPAVVIRPDDPWREPQSFCNDFQRYVAVGVVAAASGEEGVSKLLDLHTAIVRNLPPGWDYTSIGAPIIDESTGTAFLVAPVHLTFRSGALA